MTLIDLSFIEAGMELHDQIRRLAVNHHVAPALASGKGEFSIAVRELMEEAETQGISTIQRAPAFCRSIQTKDFLKRNGLSISRVEGPKSKLSTMVVVHYRVDQPSQITPTPSSQMPPIPSPVLETPAEKAIRLTEKLRGLLKDELAEYGGGEAFLKWIRSDEDEAA